MEIKELLEKKLSGLGDMIDAKLEQATEAQKANINNELDSLKKNEIEALTKSYNALQEQVDSLATSASRKSAQVVNKDWMGNLVDQIKGNSNFAADVRSHKGATFNVPSFKTGTILSGQADFVDSTTTANVVTPDYQPGVIFDPDRAQHVRDFLPQGTTTSDTVRYIQETSLVDGTAFKQEGSAGGNTTFDLTAKDAPVREIMGYVRVSREMLEDVNGLTSYLSIRLPKKIRVKEDNGLLYGVDSPYSFTGLTESASAYVDSLADSNVNRFDVLVSAIAQVRDGEYQANAIMVHPDDYFNLLLVKDAYGQYVMPDTFRFGGQAPRIAGVPLIANTAITTGDFLVGDFALGAQIFDRQQSQVRFYEQDQDNAIRGVITVVASERIALPIYRPTAFVYGTFTNALASGSA